MSDNEYIHSYKYSRIFPKRIYSDIHSKLFTPHEYIRTFIRNVRFQQIHSNKAVEQTNCCYSKKIRHNISAIDVNMITPLLIPYLIFTTHLYSFVKISKQYFLFEYICTFIREYTKCTNLFGHSFVKI